MTKNKGIQLLRLSFPQVSVRLGRRNPFSARNGCPRADLRHDDQSRTVIPACPESFLRQEGFSVRLRRKNDTETNEQMKKQKSKFSVLSNFQSSILNSHRNGFTLLEVLIALAVVGGLLVTLIYTLNYQLSLVERQEAVTVATLLAKSKMIELEKVPEAQKGVFAAPFNAYTYETSVKDSPYPGIGEIAVSVRADKEEVKLNEFILK
jgi:general secretion pathway protein I